MAHAIEAPASTTAEGPTSHTQNQTAMPSNTYGYSREEQVAALHKLREPFSPTEVRHMPRVWCKACKSAGWNGCQNHPVSKCGKCKQKMPAGGHIDLAYVGHAEATNRLLNVDPFWDWEPLTVDERGLPQDDGYRGLWIRLTVCGMTRLGYGHAGDKTGGDAIKEVIGDAIRNAGMRFGMALDLWTTSDLEIVEAGNAPVDSPASHSTAAAPSVPQPVQDQRQPDGAPLPRLMQQIRECWDTRLPLVQIQLEGKKLGLSDEQVQGPTGAWTTFDALVDGRIQELKKAAMETNSERSAA